MTQKEKKEKDKIWGDNHIGGNKKDQYDDALAAHYCLLSLFFLFLWRYRKERHIFCSWQWEARAISCERVWENRVGIRGGDHLMEPGRKDECPRKKRTTKVGRSEGLNDVSHIFLICMGHWLMLGIFLHFFCSI